MDNAFLLQRGTNNNFPLSSRESSFEVNKANLSISQSHYTILQVNQRWKFLWAKAQKRVKIPASDPWERKLVAEKTSCGKYVRIYSKRNKARVRIRKREVLEMQSMSLNILRTNSAKQENSLKKKYIFFQYSYGTTKVRDFTLRSQEEKQT